VNPLLDLWRKLDRYLIRNHVELWSLQVHRLHAGALGATAVLALAVFLLPFASLLTVAQGLRVVVTLFLGLFLLVLPLLLSRQEPFVRRSRWPHALSVWYCLLVTSTPILTLPWMIQTRVRQQVLHGRDAERWSSTLQSSPSHKSLWDEHCKKAMAESGPDLAESVESTCSLLSPTWLDPLVLGADHTTWLSVLLLLLLLAQRSMFIFSAAGEFFLEGVALISALFVAPFIGLLFIAVSLDAPTSGFVSGTLAVLVVCSLAHVARARRITPTLVMSWSAVLTGVPLLAILGASLLNPKEAHSQALLLGLALLVTAGLQRVHDRVRALPS
jgi:hypothetical protein